MIRKSRVYKFVMVVLLIVLILVTIYLKFYKPSLRQWNFCFTQLSGEIEANNLYLKENNSSHDDSCALQKQTILRSEECFKNVAEMNFYTRWALKNRPVKELERIKGLQISNCGSN